MYHDWIMGLLGGGLIGMGGAVLLLGNGHIMGASGILGNLLARRGKGPVLREQLAFVLAVVLVPFFLHFAANVSVETVVTDNVPLLLVAGLLVGIGTRLANGCTSGHGVCGISRLSKRGILATCLYIGVGMATVAILRHLFGAFT